MSGDATRRAPLVALVALVVALTGVVVFLAYPVVVKPKPASTPEDAVRRMLDAYATFDAEELLLVTTHETVSDADGRAAFVAQAEQARAAAKGRPLVRGARVSAPVSQASGGIVEAESALVKVSAEWLDADTGEYQRREENIPVVRRGDVWLVYMF